MSLWGVVRALIQRTSTAGKYKKHQEHKSKVMNRILINNKLGGCQVCGSQQSTYLACMKPWVQAPVWTELKETLLVTCWQAQRWQTSSILEPHCADMHTKSIQENRRAHSQKGTVCRLAGTMVIKIPLWVDPLRKERFILQVINLYRLQRGG